MTLRLLTCNALFNKAIADLNEVMKEINPDIVCLQEVNTSDENLKRLNGGLYQLADFSNSFIQFNQIFGLATYYNSKILSFVNSENFDLARSFTETLMMVFRMGRSERSVLKTEFISKNNNKKMTIYNIHCSSWGSNRARDKQIKKMLSDLDINSKDPIIIAGDFNYPYGRKKFEKIIASHNLNEATNNLFFTFEMKFLGFIPIRWKNDYVLYKNIKLLETKSIKIRSSDHYPIISTFEI